MQRQLTKKRLGIALGIAMVAAACGGNDADSATADDEAATTTLAQTDAADDESGDPEQEPTTTEATEATEATDTTEPPVEEPPAPPVPDQWLEGVAETGAPSNTGWPVAAGRWASGAFDPAIAFDLPAGLTVIDHSPWSVLLGLDQPGSTGQIHLVRTSTLTLSTDVSVPVPRELDEIDEFLSASETSTVTNQGRIETAGAETGWWEVVVDEDIPGQACSIGDNCVMVAATTGSTPVLIDTGEPFVIFAHHADSTRYGAWVTGPDDERAELAAAAEELFGSLAVLARDVEAPEFDSMFISSLSQSRSGFPAGSYHHNLGGNHIQIELAEPVDGVSVLVAQPEMFILGMPAGDLAVINYERAVVDPSVSQAGADPETASGFARLDEPPSSIEEWSTYADELGVLTATGTAVIGGDEIPWFEFDVEPGTGFDCWPGYLGGAEECIEFLSVWSHSDAESANRHFVFGDEHVMVVLWPAPSSTIEEVASSYETILAGLTVTASQ